MIQVNVKDEDTIMKLKKEIGDNSEYSPTNIDLFSEEKGELYDSMTIRESQCTQMTLIVKGATLILKQLEKDKWIPTTIPSHRNQQDNCVCEYPQQQNRHQACRVSCCYAYEACNVEVPLRQQGR